MGLDLSRWFKYAKARVDAAFASGHEELDEMEAERAAILAEKPWLGADDETPTLDQARARIEWEARRQAEGSAPGGDAAGSASGGSEGSEGSERGGRDRTGRGPDRRGSDEPTAGDAEAVRSGADGQVGSGTGVPPGSATAADAAAAKIELEDKRRKTAERLAEIRRELGVDDQPT